MQNHHSSLTKILAAALFLTLPLVAATPAKAPAPAAPAASAASAAPASKGAVVLNQKDIHAAYNEGDFDKVTALIDAFNKANKTYSRADSIFIAKHLAVVYSANPQSREKGKYYMYRLLEMMPSAELVDMFVSDEIDRIFDKVRKEFLTRQKVFGVDSAQISMPQKASTGSAAAASTGTASAKPEAGPSKEFLAANQDTKQPYWKRNGFWIAGGVGLVVAGTAAYFIYSQNSATTGKTIVIPNGSSTAQQ
ncbi:MAG: hypothetical protein JWM16_6410 [Verrucomicrobiales bacterium]|nr:hypothetical protein [Verrucomicrobiales bacterium]